MLDLLIALAVGVAAGTHAATWGMYKDSIYEGFSRWKYARSILLASGLALLAQSVLQLDLLKAGSLVLLFGVTYVLERGLFEFYKVFLREEDQSKYFIPMAFAVGREVVRSRTLRRLAGAGYLGCLALAIVGVNALAGAAIPLPAAILVVLLGSITGWVSAFGGAWKDAPSEGFQLLKFFRSPVIAAGYALVLATITTNYLIIAVGALGFTIATIETWKKFFSPTKAPGKFAGKPVRHPEMFHHRRRFLPVYVTIWILLVLTFGLALLEPHEGVLSTSVLNTEY
jgi:hypothetical protein